MLVKPVKRIRENIKVPGDKSISHRSIMLSAIAKGESNIYNFLMGEDCLNTINCFRKLGVNIDMQKEHIKVQGAGLRGLHEPGDVLDVGNSGTTIRVMTGILCGQTFECEVTGDASIQKRPMGRIIKPLRQMGANIYGNVKENFAPLKIRGGNLKGINYEMPIASAQVKSAVLLAGLYAQGVTTIREPHKSRNHTELMLNSMGGDIEVKGLEIICRPVDGLFRRDAFIPGDISSAAFFLVLGAISEDGELFIRDVGLNENRTGIIDILIQMGANIKILNKRYVSGERMGDILVKSSKLRAVDIYGDMVPRLIDEIPVLAVAACFSEGTTTIRDAQELKVKESNRLEAIVCELKKIGANIEETDDGMRIKGGRPLSGGQIESHNDHRIAMAMAIAGLVSEEGVYIDNPECVAISFPEFFNIVERIISKK